MSLDAVRKQMWARSEQKSENRSAAQENGGNTGMKKILFNNTDLQVSELCLGTANFGTVRSVEESFEQMDIFTEAGGNFIDTALVYGDWGCNGKGRSEKVIGQWMALRKKRDQVILSTKGCHPPAEDMNVPRVNAAEICSDVEDRKSVV